MSVSLRIAILKILAARPDGTVSLATVRLELALLMSVSRWAGRDNAMIQRNSPPDLFSSGFVITVGDSWKISPEGRAYLNASSDNRLAPEIAPAEIQSTAAEYVAITDHPQRPLTLIASKRSKPITRDSGFLDQARLPPARALPRRLRIARRR